MMERPGLSLKRYIKVLRPIPTQFLYPMVISVFFMTRELNVLMKELHLILFRQRSPPWFNKTVRILNNTNNCIFIYTVLLLLLLGTAGPVPVIGQVSAPHDKYFTWHKTELPVPSGSQNHPGLAGAFSGLSNNVLIIAGGANFPDSPPWDGGEKVWNDRIYVLSVEGLDYKWINSSGFKLEQPVAYGVSISIPQGLLCIGGDNAGTILSDIFLLDWDDVAKKIVNRKLPSLPRSFEATGGAVIEGNLYVTGIANNDNSLIRVELNKLFQNQEVDWEHLPPCPGPPRKLMSYSAQSNGESRNLYVFGGRSEVDGELTILSDSYAYNVEKNLWREIGRGFPGGNGNAGTMGAPALAYGAGSIFIFGGDDGDLLLERHGLEKAV